VLKGSTDPRAEVNRLIHAELQQRGQVDSKEYAVKVLTARTLTGVGGRTFVREDLAVHGVTRCEGLITSESLKECFLHFSSFE
jgi:hypothetical protein